MCTQWSQMRHKSPAKHTDAITTVLKVFVSNVILVDGTVGLYSNVGEAKKLQSGIAAQSRKSIALQATLLQGPPYALHTVSSPCGTQLHK